MSIKRIIMIIIMIIFVVANDYYCIDSIRWMEKHTEDGMFIEHLNVEEYLGSGTSKKFDLQRYRDGKEYLAFSEGYGQVRFSPVYRYVKEKEYYIFDDFPVSFPVLNYRTDIVDVSVYGPNYARTKELATAAILIALKQKKFPRFSKEIMANLKLKVIVMPIVGRAAVVTSEMEKILSQHNKIYELPPTEESGNVITPELKSVDYADETKRKQFFETVNMRTKEFLTPHAESENIYTMENSIIFQKVREFSYSPYCFIKFLLKNLFNFFNKIIFFASVSAICIVLMWVSWTTLSWMIINMGLPLVEVGGILGFLPLGAMYLALFVAESFLLTMIINLPYMIITNNIDHYHLWFFGFNLFKSEI